MWETNLKGHKMELPVQEIEEFAQYLSEPARKLYENLQHSTTNIVTLAVTVSKDQYIQGVEYLANLFNEATANSHIHTGILCKPIKIETAPFCKKCDHFYSLGCLTDTKDMLKSDLTWSEASHKAHQDCLPMETESKLMLLIYTYSQHTVEELNSLTNTKYFTEEGGFPKLL